MPKSVLIVGGPDDAVAIPDRDSVFVKAIARPNMSGYRFDWVLIMPTAFTGMLSEQWIYNLRGTCVKSDGVIINLCKDIKL